MPYIKQENRWRFDDLGSVEPCSSGELNYVFTRIAHEYWSRCGSNYQAYNDIIGALEGCKLELYRRRVALYEDAAMERNGDVG